MGNAIGLCGHDGKYTFIVCSCLFFGYWVLPPPRYPLIFKEDSTICIYVAYSLKLCAIPATCHSNTSKTHGGTVPVQAIAHLQLLRRSCYEIQALTVEPIRASITQDAKETPHKDWGFLPCVYLTKILYGYG